MSEKNFAAASLAAQAMGWIDPVTKAVVPPIHMASTYQRDEDNGYRSGRGPDDVGELRKRVEALEARIAELESRLGDARVDRSPPG